MRVSATTTNHETGEITDNQSGTHRFTKIKVLKEQKIEIHYQILMGEQWDDISMVCNEEAQPSFYDAMQALAPHVLSILDLPEMYIAGLTVKSVSLNYTQDVMGAVITSTKVLRRSNAPFVLNTPHKPSEPYGAGADDICLDSDTVQAIEDLCFEALQYVNGHRRQMSLFDQAPTTRENRATAPSTDRLRSTTTTVGDGVMTRLQ